MKKYLVASLLLFTVATASWAQDALQKLLNTKDLECNFPIGHLSEWREGEMNTQEAREDIRLHFLEINVPRRTAKMVGNNFSAYVTAFATPSGLTFFEITPAGNVTLTNVFPHYDNLGNYSAVFSRHIFAEISPIVSQWKGQCHRLATQQAE